MTVETANATTMNVETRPLLHQVTGAGDPIVLVPGTLTGWAGWIAPAERLAAHRKVVRVQVRNVELVEAGKAIPETYSLLEERDALLATVDQLGLKRFDLAGWSLGGAVALAFALEYPERVRSLTLVEPASFWVLRETGHAAEALAAEESRAREWKGKEITVEDLGEFLGYAGLGAPESYAASHPRWPLMVQNRQALASGGAELAYVDSLDRLRNLQTPILAIKGRETAKFLSVIIDDIVDVAPNATMLELPGGHAAHLENLDQFLAELEHHLSRVQDE